MPAQCPDYDRLLDLSLGKLLVEESEALVQHLERCPECEAAAATLDQASDTLVSQLREPKPDGESSTDLQYEQAAAQVKLLAPELLSAAAPRASVGVRADEPPAPLGRLREYELLEKIGQGGMGAVYRARHSKLKRIVALKVLPPELMQSRGAVARFEREMEAVGKLSHPNIVAAHDAGEVSGAHFLVMEYVDGSDLSSLARRLGRLSVADACEIVRQAALGLQHAHEHGLVHRDVKPSNLMLTPAGQVKVLDLGLALLNAESPGEELTTVGQAMGTIDYMAPEQASDSHLVDIRADLYGLGATLYRLLTGGAPFSGAQYNTVARKLVALETAPIPPVRSKRDDVPEALAALIDHRLLNKQPAERLATPVELAAALVPFCEGHDLPLLLSNELTAELPPPVEMSQATPPQLSSAATDTVSQREPMPVAGILSARRHRKFEITPGRSAVAALFFALLAGIVIKIKNESGHVIGEIDFPGGTSATIERDGRLVGTVDGSGKVDAQAGAASSSPATPLPPQETAEQFTANPPPVSLPDTQPLSLSSLVTRPAPLPGVKAWTLETIPARGHGSRFRPFALDPEGKQFVLTDDGSTLRIFDTATRQLVRAIVVSGRARTVDWSRDGELIAARGDESVWIVDSASGKVLNSFAVSRSSYSDLHWSSDSQWLAISGGSLRLWDRKRQTISDEPKLNGACRLAWSPVAPILAAACSDRAVRLFDLSARKLLHKLPAHGWGSYLAWSADGARLAICHEPPDNTIRFWDAKTGEDLATLPSPSGSYAPAWSPDGKWLAVAVAGSNTAHHTHLFDAHTYQAAGKAPGHYWQVGITHQVWSPDGALLYRAPLFFQHQNTCLDVVNLEEKKRVAGWTGFGGDALRGLSPDGKQLLARFADSIKRIAVDENRSDALKSWGNSDVTWSADGQFVAAANASDGTMLFDRSFQKIVTLPPKWSHTSVSRSLSPDGYQLAVGGDKALEIWDCEKGTRIFELPVDGRIDALAWSSSGKFLAAWTASNVVIYDASAPATPIYQLRIGYARRTDHEMALHWSSTGEFLLIAAGQTLRVIDPGAGEVLRTVSAPAPVQAADYDPQRRRLVFVVADGAVLESTVGDLAPIKSLGATQPCYSARFLGGGRLLTTRRYQDATLFLWDGQTFQPRGVIVPFNNEHHLFVSPDGHYRGTPGIEEHLVYVIETEAGQETLTPVEFASRFGWKNDPGKALPGGYNETLASETQAVIRPTQD